MEKEMLKEFIESIDNILSPDINNESYISHVLISELKEVRKRAFSDLCEVEKEEKNEYPTTKFKVTYTYRHSYARMNFTVEYLNEDIVSFGETIKDIEMYCLPSNAVLIDIEVVE